METLHSVIVLPIDMEMRDQALFYTFISHAEKKGMSVLRGDASDDEFRKVIETRIGRDSSRRFHGVASVQCAEIRQLTAVQDGEGRLKGDRLYCVLDTDIEGLPHHADVFATVPRPETNVTPKSAWRRQRSRLMDLMRTNFLSAPEFRGNLLPHS